MTAFTTYDSKMKKDVENVEVVKESPRRTVALLAVTLAVITVCFVVLLSYGAWYTHNLKDASAKQTETEHFEISVNFEGEIFPEHVIANTEGQSVLVIIRDPQNQQVHTIMFVDFENRKEIIYRRDENYCVVVPLSSDFTSFSEELSLVASQNGTTLDEPSKTYYKTYAPISDPNLIPRDMQPYCTLTNTYSGVEMESDTGDRQKRHSCACACWLFCCCICTISLSP